MELIVFLGVDGLKEMRSMCMIDIFGVVVLKGCLFVIKRFVVRMKLMVVKMEMWLKLVYRL